MNSNLVKQLETLIADIRKNPDYIAAAVSHGQMDPKLHAVSINGAKNWEYLSHKFSELQDRVSELGLEMIRFVLDDDGEVDKVTVSVRAIRALKKIGITIVLDVNPDDDAAPIMPHGVFEATTHLKFAI
jgi:ribosomal protein L28